MSATDHGQLYWNYPNKCHTQGFVKGEERCLCCNIEELSPRLAGSTSMKSKSNKILNKSLYKSLVINVHFHM